MVALVIRTTWRAPHVRVAGTTAGLLGDTQLPHGVTGSPASCQGALTGAGVLGSGMCEGAWGEASRAGDMAPQRYTNPEGSSGSGSEDKGVQEATTTGADGCARLPVNLALWGGLGVGSAWQWSDMDSRAVTRVRK